MTGLDMRDFVSGFRLYSRAVTRIAAYAEAMLLGHQVLLLAGRRGLRITEVALSLQTPKTDHSKISQSWANAMRNILAPSLLGMAHKKGSHCSPVQKNDDARQPRRKRMQAVRSRRIWCCRYALALFSS